MATRSQQRIRHYHRQKNRLNEEDSNLLKENTFPYFKKITFTKIPDSKNTKSLNTPLKNPDPQK